MTPYQHTVQYYETDQMQSSHHSNYIRWMEEARVAFLAELGFPYEKLEASSLISPVVSLKCDYKAPTTFADIISITVKVKQFSGVRLVLGYQMTLPDQTVVCLAESSHCFTTKAGNIVNLKKTNPDFFELPAIKIAGIASRDYITCTLKNDTRSEPSYNDWKYRHYAKYIIFTNYCAHFDSLRVIRIILCY